MLKLVLCLLVLATGVARGQTPSLETGRIFCGAAPLLAQGIDIPVRAVYKPDRHRNLRHTMTDLLRGEAIQTVMLGDSIVGDTFGPQYAASGWHRGTSWGVEPLAALYRTDIYSVVSVLGSTGAWYYRQPGNVQTYVLDNLPDLVFIGGISNREDIDAIRDVVLQIHTARPGTEIILMTGAVNLQNIPANSSLLLNNAAGTYEARLSSLADELGTGFINMRGSYDEFVIEANKQHPEIDHNYFQRDPIHANDYGRAILREIITMFFRPGVECQDRAADRQRVPSPQIMTTTVAKTPSIVVPTAADTHIANTLYTQAAKFSDTVLEVASIDVDQSGVADRIELLSSSSADTNRLKITIDPATSATNTVTTLPMNLIGGLRLLFADIDQDGWQDLVVGTDTGTPYLYVYVNTGATGQLFFNPTLLAKGDRTGCTVGLAAIDMNSDGKSDLFAANGCNADSGSIDYYQLDTSVLHLDRQLPESYQTDMNVMSISVGGASVQHLAPSLQILGARNGSAASMELGVAKPVAAVPENAPETEGGGAMGWIELMLFALALLASGYRPRRIVILCGMIQSQ